MALSKVYGVYPDLTDVIIQAAIAGGVSINSKNANGDTPLHLTMRSCQLLLAWNLINNYGASQGINNAVCQSPVDVAREACKWQFFGP
jgi:ankyrin repeat protein